MRLHDFDTKTFNLKELTGVSKSATVLTLSRNQKVETNTIQDLINLISDAKKLLFPKGRYKKIKKWQFGCIWKASKMLISFVLLLMKIF